MRWKANCPECDWSHDYQAHWACKGCHEPTDLFDLCSDRAGICPPCGEVHVRLVCPGCEQWTRFDGWREHEPLTKGEWVGLVAGVLTMLVAGWQVSNHLGGLDELAGALLLLSPIVAGFGVGVLLQWFVDGRISPHAREFVTDLRGLGHGRTTPDLGGAEFFLTIANRLKDVRKERLREFESRPPGALLAQHPGSAFGRGRRRRRR